LFFVNNAQGSRSSSWHRAFYPRVVKSALCESSSGEFTAIEDGSFMPRGVENRLIILIIFLLPHRGQIGKPSGFIRFEKKLNITRHSGQANS
jgi:hypothetical protein